MFSFHSQNAAGFPFVCNVYVNRSLLVYLLHHHCPFQCVVPWWLLHFYLVRFFSGRHSPLHQLL